MSYATLFVDVLRDMNKSGLELPKITMLRRVFVAEYSRAIRKLTVPPRITAASTPEAWEYLGRARLARSTPDIGMILSMDPPQTKDQNSMADVRIAIETMIDDVVVPKLDIGQEEIKEAEEWEKLSMDKRSPTLLLLVLKQLALDAEGKKEIVCSQ